MIKRIEIDKEYAEVLAELMLGSEFDWYWNGATLLEGDYGTVVDSKTKDMPQFTHTILIDKQQKSIYYHYFSEMFGIIEKEVGNKIKKVIRIKANLMVGDSSYPEGCYNGPHIDYAGSNLLSFVYYVNDSDGDTILFDKHLDGKQHNITELKEIDRQTPKGGTGILFDSNLVHTSTTPKFTDRRVVVNYVLEMEDETNDTKF
jgi:hypothetical protein